MNEKKLWEHVRKAEQETCWPWLGRRVPQGYGVLRWGPKNARATRVIWNLLHGPIPDGMVIRHKCDNPPCCNPGHLELGTPADNNRDRMLRGRSNPTKGVAHHNSKLTEGAVRHIRENPDALTQTALAVRFGVPQPTNSEARNGNQWAHINIARSVPERLADGRHWNAKVGEADRQMAVSMREAGHSHSTIGAAIGLSQSAVSRLLASSSDNL